jgi:hypothetical protein
MLSLWVTDRIGEIASRRSQWEQVSLNAFSTIAGVFTTGSPYNANLENEDIGVA